MYKIEDGLQKYQIKILYTHALKYNFIFSQNIRYVLTSDFGILNSISGLVSKKIEKYKYSILRTPRID